MSGYFTSKYTDEQRDAVGVAITDRGLTATEVVRRAATGELRPNLDPFDIPVNTVRDIKRKVRARRQGTERSGLTDVPHADAVDTLRRRLIAAADQELEWVETLQKSARRTGGLKDDAAAARRAERLRQVARAVREAAAIIVPTSTRPTKPGARDPETGKTNGATTGENTLGGAILAAHQRTTGLAAPAAPTDARPPTTQDGSPTTPEPHQPTTTQHNPTQHGTPGGSAGAEIASDLRAAVRARGL